MLENRERLIGTALRPLADNAEFQLAARNLLEDVVGESVDGSSDLIERWETVDAKKKRPWVKWISAMVLMGLSAWIWTGAGRVLYGNWLSTKVAGGFGYGGFEYVEVLENAISRSLGEKERLLLFGDTSSDYKKRMKALWDSEPENAAFLMEYWVDSGGARWKQPSPSAPDFVGMITRLDPGNSWPIYYAAAERVNGELMQHRWINNDGIPIRSWLNSRAEEHDESLALLHQAAGQPRFENYRIKLANQRASLVPAEYQHGYWFRKYLPLRGSPESRLYMVFMVIAAKSWEFSRDDNREEFLKLLADFQALIGKWASSKVNSFILEGSVSQGVSVTIPELHQSALKLGLAKEAGELALIHGRLQAHKNEKNLTRLPVPNDFLVNRSAVILSDVLDWKVPFPEGPPTLDELKPGRLIDHELLSLGCCLAAWLIFGACCSVCALFRFRLPAILGRLSQRIESLLRSADYVYIIGGGILLPYLFTMFINRLTPLGGRELGVHGTFGFLPSAQFAAMVLLILIATTSLTQWRLKKRAAIIGFNDGRSPMSLFSALSAAVLIPISGWIFLVETDRSIWFLLAICFGALPVLWLLVIPLRALCGKDKMRLMIRGVIARALTPVHAAAMLLMVFAGQFHKIKERHWFQEDTIMRMDPEFPAMSPYEHRLAKQMRKETIEILGLQPVNGVLPD